MTKKGSASAFQIMSSGSTEQQLQTIQQAEPTYFFKNAIICTTGLLAKERVSNSGKRTQTFI